MESSEVIELLAEALATAWLELEQLRNTPWPMPDKVRKELDERDALAETFQTLPESQRVELRQVYTEKLGRASGRNDDLSAPVDAEVLAMIEAAYEVLRRQAIFDPALREAIRRLEP